MNCTVLSLNIVLFLISLLRDGKILYELGSSLDCSSDADFFATSMMHPPDVLGWYRNEIQMLSKFYVDTELALTLLEHDMFGGSLRLLYCFVAELLFVADIGLWSEVFKGQTFFFVI